MISHTSQNLKVAVRSVAFQQLLARPVWRSGEGRLGYLKRVATENDLSNSMLSEVDFAAAPNFLAYNNFINCLPSSSWNIRFARFCPYCLDVDPIWRREWELLFFDSCPMHQCQLIDICAQCSMPLTWRRKHLLICDCGLQLQHMRPHPCSRNVSQLSLAISNSVAPVGSIGEFSTLHNLTTAQIQRVVRLLGSVGDVSRNIRSQKIAYVDRIEVSSILTNVAADILIDWPTAFHKLLISLEHQYRTSFSSRRLPKCFGTLHASIFNTLHDPCYEFLRSAFNQYVLINWPAPIAKRNKRIPENQRMHGAWVPSSHACHELKISPRRLQKMIEDGLIIGEIRVNSENGRNYTVIQREQLNASSQHVHNFVDLQTAAKLIGFSKKRIGQLRNILFPDAKKTLEINNAPWMINLADINRILDVGQALLECMPSLESEITFSHMIRHWMWGHADIADFIVDCVRGVIRPISLCTGKRGIGSWIFSRQVVSQWLAKHNAINRLDMSVQEFARYFGIKQEVAYFLVRNDFITSIESVLPRGREKRISFKSADDFSERYVFLAELAKRTKCSSRGLLSRLAAMGIHPVSGPHIDEGRQLLMRKNAQLELAITQISLEQANRYHPQ
ncbi:TniQ family protein [Undibacterium sp. CY22W]|uniref:TniQ family protein n=2 Tax=Undibacterium curvum TaxID=2762294 RepID=A0ABR7A7J0_9BURK|nr:TniQ family protein [Undibacterium curvum]